MEKMICMKKDIFNGNVKKEYVGSVIVALVFGSIVFFVCFLVFLIGALTYDKIEYAARIFIYVMAGVSFLSSVIYPAVTIWAIRTYPKYPKLTKLMIKPYVLNTKKCK